MNIIEKIKALKEKHKALILAHNYLCGIQDIADCGDSLAPPQGGGVHAPHKISFAAFDSMGEIAKILSSPTQCNCQRKLRAARGKWLIPICKKIQKLNTKHHYLAAICQDNGEN